MPIIAGLDAAYFRKQIEDYAAGRRLSAEMEPYAKQVRDLGVDDVAAYFASRRREPTPVPSPADAIERGAVRPPSAWSATGHGARATRPRASRAWPARPPATSREQMLLFKQDRRSPGRPGAGGAEGAAEDGPGRDLR